MAARICDLCGSEYLGNRRCADITCRRNGRRRRFLFEEEGLQRIAVHGDTASATFGSADPGFAFSRPTREPPPRPSLGLPQPWPGSTGTSFAIVQTPHGHLVSLPVGAGSPGGHPAGTAGAPPPPASGTVAATRTAGEVSGQSMPHGGVLPSPGATAAGESLSQAGYPEEPVRIPPPTPKWGGGDPRIRRDSRPGRQLPMSWRLPLQPSS